MAGPCCKCEAKTPTCVLHFRTQHDEESSYCSRNWNEVSVFSLKLSECSLSSQSPRWALSRAHSAVVVGASARIPTISQKTATFRATMTCFPSERAPRPPQRGSAANDPARSWCLQPWDSQGAERHSRAPSSLVYHLSWLLICPADNCCTLSRISARGLYCIYKWQMDKCHTLGILILLFFFFFMAVNFIETGMQHIYTVIYWLKK